MSDKARRRRAPGGGRKKLTARDGSLLADLQRLVRFSTTRSGKTPLVWTCKSTAQLAAELQQMGHNVSQRSVHGLLSDMNFELRSVGRNSRDYLEREAQFQFASRKTEFYLAAGYPVISLQVRNGQQSNFESIPARAGQRASSVSLVRLSIELLRTWWRSVGHACYSGATEVLIIIDAREGIGRLSSRWRSELQQLANECHLIIGVCHLPPGTHRWQHKEPALKCQINGMGGNGKSMSVDLWLLGASLSTACAFDKRLIRPPKSLPVRWNYEVSPLRDPV